MADVYKIGGVPYLTQRDNAIEPGVSCFPTSVGMAMSYCLNTVSKTKLDIGCADNMQIEDYINQVISSSEVDKWMKTQTKKLGDWIWGVKKRTILYTETYVFNLLMNKHGFKAEASTDLDYDGICNFLEINKLPCVISGNFKSVSSVQGHMNCLLGFNKIGMKEFVVHDPWGDALTGYTNRSGNDKSYGLKFYLKEKDRVYAMLISRNNI